LKTNQVKSAERRSTLIVVFVLLSFSCVCRSQTQNDGLSGADAHEDAGSSHEHLFGDWRGKRTELENKGVSCDLQYIADHLWNVGSAQKTRLADWNRVRGTVNIDLGTLAGARGLYFHITGLWQGGGILGAYLGAIASPSGMSSANTFRLDSYWLERRFLHESLVVRLGQFAGQDFYGAQHDATSFIVEPLDYAMGNLSVNYESFDPPSTPAAEVRVIPREHFYVKSMVFAADRVPYAHNPTGFVPQFRGAAMTASEIGWTPGQSARDVRAFDTVRSRTGYSGLYQFGGTYNPGKFTSTSSSTPVSGNYLIYGMASQALWRTAERSSTGVDITASVNWSPADRSRRNQETTAGLRYNELLPIHWHNTLSLGYVRSGVNYLGNASNVAIIQRRDAEHVLELNALFKPTGWLLLQPVVQHFFNVGGKTGDATVVGFRSKVEF